ncbi:MAG: hypothetical protein COB30_017280 [Ectothiorhodospiraceae bacterium]|nr:hypothetical protein [Thiotrichaceae bacterium]MBL1277835.1 hypothetical protein [Ectothiorhodospiraceae bacterium]
MTLFKFFFSGVVFFMLTACVNSNDQLKPVMADCPINFKLSDTGIVSDYYASFVSNASQYIAFKAFSSSGYKLVSLVKNDNHYVLSVSLPPIPNGTLSKEIDPELGRRVFGDIKKIKILDYFNGGASAHTQCVIAGMKTSNSLSVSSLYNPPLFIHKYGDSQNSGLRLYSVLTSLADTQLPNHEDKIISSYNSKSTSVKISGRTFYADTYTEPTENESSEFLRKLRQSPFFEMD